MAGFLELEKANVRWLLSVDRQDLPEPALVAGKSTFRSIKVDGEEIEFSDGFTDLHTMSYLNILAGNGFGIEEARPSIDLVYRLRHAQVNQKTDDETLHPHLKAV
jgi:UDP-N-acetyl-2-amino-2-deoxyglucuronate dehydrogenase